MRPNTVKIIIFITSLALIGLVVSQTFWIRQEVILTREQFEHRADNALRDIVSELRNHPNKKVYAKNIEHKKNIKDVLDTTFLDFLVQKYVNYHHLDNRCYYAVFCTKNDSVIYKSANFPKYKEAANRQRACLSSIYPEDYHYLAIFFPEKNKSIFADQIMWFCLTLLFLIIISIGFGLVIFTYLRQKKLSEMKNDFINNVTHEFKTPVSTIALATEVLMKSDHNADRVNNYAKIIHDENERMRKQIERVLEVAQQDHNKIKLNIEQFDIHKLIYSVVSELADHKSDKEIQVKYSLDASKSDIHADIMYVVSVISNITDNAIKYSLGTPELTITSQNHRDGILISFIDNGIGIARESLKYIFNKFYRVSTGDVHNVKGSGLGLFYAKVLTEGHGGFIKVTSELNKGSKFDVYFPYIPSGKK